VEDDEEGDCVVSCVDELALLVCDVEALAVVKVMVLVELFSALDVVPAALVCDAETIDVAEVMVLVESLSAVDVALAALVCDVETVAVVEVMAFVESLYTADTAPAALNCVVKTTLIEKLDASPVEVALGAAVLVEPPSPSQELVPSPPSSPGSPEVVPFPGTPFPFPPTVLFPEGVLEVSCPVMPPETPVASILASASDWESHETLVPALLTRGRAKHEVPAPHVVSCHPPLSH
jgi:hypothetical protein